MLSAQSSLLSAQNLVNPQRSELSAQFRVQCSVFRLHVAVWWTRSPWGQKLLWDISLYEVHWLLNSLKMFENASLWLILFVEENPKKTILWAISAFCIFQKKTFQCERSGWSFWPWFLCGLSFLICARREEGVESRAWTFLPAGHLLSLSCVQTGSSVQLLRQSEAVLSPRYCCICQTQFFLGPHMFLFPMWYCFGWPQK